jgi:hypothetical protein
MNVPVWIKPALMGAVVGAIALAIVGFKFGGWMTAGKAAMAASDEANVQVVAALLPICMEQSGKDPKLDETIAKLKDAPSYQRADVVMKAGWATMPGATDANQQVAMACAGKLIN